MIENKEIYTQMINTKRNILDREASQGLLQKVEETYANQVDCHRNQWGTKWECSHLLTSSLQPHVGVGTKMCGHTPCTLCLPVWQPRLLYSFPVSPSEDAHHLFRTLYGVNAKTQSFLVGPIWIPVLFCASDFSSGNNLFALGFLHLENWGPTHWLDGAYSTFWALANANSGQRVEGGIRVMDRSRPFCGSYSPVGLLIKSHGQVPVTQ